MKTGNIKILPDVIERIKQLPFCNNKHLDEEKYKNLGYNIVFLNLHEQYGTGDALGDWVEFGHNDVHFGGNLGPDIRYTLQITGVVQ